MQPTVRRLEDTYGDEVTFVRLNAESDTGARLFQQLGLPGHPSYVIFTPDGREVFRTFGVVAPDVLETPLLDVLQP
jgi:hypothetical protein